MSEIIIKAENLGKKYTIGHQTDNGNYVALRDVLMRNAQNLWTKTKDLARGKPVIIGDTTEEFWALKDLNFEIRRGETLGVIGRNGAGKSTLLKVLSRITEPSAGRVTIRGTVASLLEVGTGFHPELTGRENIFLNGAILGMTRSEIKTKFDEIVAFAEVEKFLDTPVKRYSSGMYVRLAFAVAAHLEPEILVVDEVLAVGDASFQKKCLGKMENVAKEGRTVLFVSHNMAAIQSLCHTAILLENGMIVSNDGVRSVVENYLKSVMMTQNTIPLVDRLDRVGGDRLKFTSYRLKSSGSQDSLAVFCGGEVRIEIEFNSHEAHLDHLRVGIMFREQMSGMPLLELNSYYSNEEILTCREGVSRMTFRVKKFPLSPGTYMIGLIATRGLEVLDWVKEVGAVTVHEGNFYTTGRMPISNNTKYHCDYSCKLDGG